MGKPQNALSVLDLKRTKLLWMREIHMDTQVLKVQAAQIGYDHCPNFWLAFSAPVYTTPPKCTPCNSVREQKVKLIHREEADLILQSLGEGWAVHKVRRALPLQTGALGVEIPDQLAVFLYEGKGMWV